MEEFARAVRLAVGAVAVFVCTPLIGAACGDEGGEPDPEKPGDSSNGAGGGGAAGDTGNGSAGEAPTGSAETTSGGGSGAGGSGGGSSASGTINPDCGEPPENCDTPGAICVDNVLIGCTLDDQGCLVEANTDCGDDICDHLREIPTCAPRGGQTADSCENKRFLEGPETIAGSSFSTDFSNRQDFRGDGCQLAAAGAPDSMFVIDVAAGQTLSVLELEDSVGAYGLDAVFGIMAGCSDATACVASGGNNDRHGISYTAESDETLVVWVSGNSAWDGPYDIRIELPESLGPLGGNEELSPIEGGELADGEWHARVIHLEEPAVLAGTVSSGYANVVVADELGEVALNSTSLTHFAAVIDPSTYRVTVSSIGALSEYLLSLYTRPWTDLGSYGAGDQLDEELPSVPEGDSRFYTFEVTERVSADVFVDSVSGDPDVWLFTGSGTFWSAGLTLGATEEFTPEAMAAGTYLLQVEAYEGFGDISSHTLQIDFNAP